MKISKKLSLKKQSGFVIAAELLLISTILVLGLITGFTKVRDQTLAELSDTGSAIGAINETYAVTGTIYAAGGPTIADVSGFAYEDAPDAAPNAVGGDNTNINYASFPAGSTTGVGTSEIWTFNKP